MINSTERARDALCGDRQTAVSSEDISLKSKVLVLNVLQVFRWSCEISLKPSESTEQHNCQAHPWVQGQQWAWPEGTASGTRVASQQRTLLSPLKRAPKALVYPHLVWSHRERCPRCSWNHMVGKVRGMVGQGERWWQGKEQWREHWAAHSAVRGFQAQQMALTSHAPAACSPTPPDKSHTDLHCPAWPSSKTPITHWAYEWACLLPSHSPPSPVLTTMADCSFTWITDFPAHLLALAPAAKMPDLTLRAPWNSLSYTHRHCTCM